MEPKHDFVVSIRLGEAILQWVKNERYANPFQVDKRSDSYKFIGYERDLNPLKIFIAGYHAASTPLRNKLAELLDET